MVLDLDGKFVGHLFVLGDLHHKLGLLLAQLVSVFLERLHLLLQQGDDDSAILVLLGREVLSVALLALTGFERDGLAADLCGLDWATIIHAIRGTAIDLPIVLLRG
uniref:Uncharacterized protein n=1 Tax=Favella ehrenbergii TaxID=182087 RepID=A0A7S3I5B4_9SPIT|mmetsp:Transcript_3528/g.4058  ORF Transcript_3528/g.4058 Transcript_3528/m.4058 type:complete len:106 (+) Transcript_3528:584-901(+)